MNWRDLGWTPEGYPPAWHYAAALAALMIVGLAVLS
jgi:hypothetical protein